MHSNSRPRSLGQHGRPARGGHNVVVTVRGYDVRRCVGYRLRDHDGPWRNSRGVSQASHAFPKRPNQFAFESHSEGERRTRKF